MFFNPIGNYLEKAVLQSEIMTRGIESLGKRIYDLRAARWRSQQKFSDYMQEMYGMSIHQTTLSSFERGEKFPSVENLALLARALDTNADYLLGLTDNDRPFGDVEDEVVVTVEDAGARKVVQEIAELMATATDDEREYVAGLVRRLLPKKPRIIGDE